MTTPRIGRFSGRIKPGEVRTRAGKATGVRSFRSDIDEVKMPIPMVGNGNTVTVTTRTANLLKLREKAHPRADCEGPAPW